MVLTTGLVIFGTFWLLPRGNTAEQLSEQEGLQALNNLVDNFDATGVLVGTLLQVFSLIVIIAMSVLKPWGRQL